jgi:hypothetical protein
MMISARNGSSGKQGKRLETLQARFDALEAGARERLVKALGAGQHKLGELDVALERMSHEDWSVVGMRKRLDVIRARAENMRATALKRVADMPASAVNKLANGSRAQVQSLSRELHKLAKLIEPPAPARAEPGRVEVTPAAVEKPVRVPKEKVEV